MPRCQPILYQLKMHPYIIWSHCDYACCYHCNEPWFFDTDTPTASFDAILGKADDLHGVFTEYCSPVTKVGIGKTIL